MDIRELSDFKGPIGEHWYYKSKARYMMRIMEKVPIKHLLDIGAGSGFFSDHLLRHSGCNMATCVDINYDHEDCKVVNGKKLFFKKSIDETDADTVLFMDVLEHVDDDYAFLSQYISKIKSGAYVFVTVPAFNILWSGHDIFLAHKRRYNLKQLRALISKSGLAVVEDGYIFLAIFPIAFILRITLRLFFKNGKIKSQIKNHSTFVNNFFDFLCRADMCTIRFNKLFGLTVFCLCQKK